MKYNKLLGKDKSMEVVDITVRSGRTTGMALKFIGAAMSEPGCNIILSDHGYGDSERSILVMSRKIEEICTKLGLQHLDIEDGILTYNVFGQCDE